VSSQVLVLDLFATSTDTATAEDHFTSQQPNSYSTDSVPLSSASKPASGSTRKSGTRNRNPKTAAGTATNADGGKQKNRPQLAISET
jgi:hypothetical protein